MTLACEPYHRWRIRPGTNTEVTETYRANILLDDLELSRRLLANETNDAVPTSARKAPMGSSKPSTSTS